MIKKKGIFGLFGMVLFLLAVFIVVGITLYANFSLTSIGNPPKINVAATVVSSDFSNDCDIYLMNLMRFEDPSTGLTYAELLSLAKVRNEGLLVGNRIKNIVENDVIKSTVDCFEIRAKGQNDQQEFLMLAPYGRCEYKENARLCSTYIPDMDPEDGWIKVELAIVEAP